LQAATYIGRLIDSIKSFRKYFLLQNSKKHAFCKDVYQFRLTYGNRAYMEARALARQARLQSNYSDEKKWSRIARQIAHLENRTVGLDNATRRLLD
jgi:hypothetical protein